jgi:hypothetical protein
VKQMQAAATTRPEMKAGSSLFDVG